MYLLVLVLPLVVMRNPAQKMFAMDMIPENQKNYYSLLMMALAANMPVQITYCGGCVAHGFKGPSVTVPVLQGLAVSK